MNDNVSVRKCPNCKMPKPIKGRAFDGRRAYKCINCNNVWTEGMQRREKRYSNQRYGYQFSNSKGVGHVG